MPGTVPGPGNEAVNKTGLVPGPKGQKTDKQVITVWCDETDSPGPQAAELWLGNRDRRAGRLSTVSLVAAFGFRIM